MLYRKSMKDRMGSKTVLHSTFIGVGVRGDYYKIGRKERVVNCGVCGIEFKTFARNQKYCELHKYRHGFDGGERTHYKPTQPKIPEHP